MRPICCRLFSTPVERRREFFASDKAVTLHRERASGKALTLIGTCRAINTTKDCRVNALIAERERAHPPGFDVHRLRMGQSESPFGHPEIQQISHDCQSQRCHIRPLPLRHQIHFEGATISLPWDVGTQRIYLCPEIYSPTASSSGSTFLSSCRPL